MTARSLIAAMAALCTASPALADLVVASEQVRTRVNVRALPESGSRVLGSLAKGEQLTLLESLEGWHRVALPGGGSDGEERREGFVSSRWTQVVVEQPAPAPPAPPRPAEVALAPEERPNLFRRVAYTLSRALGGGAPVSIDVQEPRARKSHLRHPDPRLPVAGFAAAGGDGNVELMLAIDASTSSNEFSEADVDGDGVLEDEWAGDDSIYQAQVLAARHLVVTLRRLPGNRNGERIRVAVITFGGDDRFALHPPDRDFDPTPISILALANRDAQLRIPLSSDYDEVDRVLAELALLEPDGMTNFAAAIGRAIVEVEGLAGLGATQAPRADALRVVDFLTDGMPSLPYARAEAERAARYAAHLANDSDIRINVFELGKNAVTRKPSREAARMAEITGGTLVQVERPGEIVRVLAATSLTFVDRVRLTNRTTGERSRFISTGLDGSFYGEIPLREGNNRIGVVAVLLDGRERDIELEVDYTPGLPTPELEKRLTLIRERNEEMIEQIRTRLAREMESQRRELDVSAGADER